MKKKLVLSILGLGGFMISVTSCSRDDDEPKTTCRINTIVETKDNSTISRVLEYDEGKLSAVKTAGGDGGSKLFSYSSGMITIITKNSTGVVTGTEEVLLNQAGRISSIKQKNAAGTTTGTNSYFYNGDGSLSMYVVTPVLGMPDTTKFTFHDGNATISTNKGNTTLYDHYSDKAFLNGDFLNLSQVINYGALALVNKNLLKMVTSSDGKVTNFSYQYDNTGKVTRLIISGATSGNYSYTYDCQ